MVLCRMLCHTFSMSYNWCITYICLCCLCVYSSRSAASKIFIQSIPHHACVQDNYHWSQGECMTVITWYWGSSTNQRHFPEQSKTLTYSNRKNNFDETSSGFILHPHLKVLRHISEETHCLRTQQFAYSVCCRWLTDISQITKTFPASESNSM